ncbi:MAG: septation regulator SpoVG [Clostridia bacterium]|nr:septation regulator SpoVG [Clostridia bacterium]
MNITEVNIKLIKNDESKLKAVATLTIDDCFAIHDIKIIKNNDELFIAMPSKKMPSGEYKDVVHPLNTETRTMLQNLILERYAQVLSEATDT